MSRYTLTNLEMLETEDSRGVSRYLEAKRLFAEAAEFRKADDSKQADAVFLLADDARAELWTTHCFLGLKTYISTEGTHHLILSDNQQPIGLKGRHNVT